MARHEEIPVRRKGVTVLNWMGTLVLASIPGVNIITLILMTFLCKSRAKRSFAIAALILIAIAIVLCAAAFLAFGDWLREFAHTQLRELLDSLAAETP